MDGQNTELEAGWHHPGDTSNLSADNSLAYTGIGCPFSRIEWIGPIGKSIRTIHDPGYNDGRKYKNIWRIFLVCTSSTWRIANQRTTTWKFFFFSMKFLRSIFSRPERKNIEIIIPPRPEDWKQTTDDLMNELKAGKRKSVGNPEISWAREYEKSLIPDDVRYPRKSDVYECLEDFSIHFMTAWKTPFTGCGEAIIRKGEKIVIHTDPESPEPIGIYALPVEYEKLELRMVPESERTHRKYNGFYFHIDTISLIRHFTLIQSGYSPDDQAE